ncbi:MAG: LysM peptidoglycan-binding domain-containing protein [Psychromonas sp.]
MKLFLSFFILLFVAACSTNSDLTSSSPKKSKKSTLIHRVDDSKKYPNLWLKLADRVEFSVPDNARIARQRDKFLRQPNYLATVSKRAEPFLYLIIEQLEERDLPLDLALLPVIESAFDPFAFSHSSASGLWQFMPVTGDRFGLKQDWWYDGRRDVYASTGAALSYMEILYGYLGDDWLYALAAYNSGEGRVGKAIELNKQQNKPADYWNLSLPQETQDYVPKFLALVDIIRNHEKYGVKLPVIKNKQVLTYVDTESQVDLTYAAKLAELSIAEMQFLNPAFNNWTTPPDGPHKLLIPTKTAEQFTLLLSNTKQNKRIGGSLYTVRAGDNLASIARNNKTTIKVLKQANDLDGSDLKIGRPILIPIASQSQQDYLYNQAPRVAQQIKAVKQEQSKKEIAKQAQTKKESVKQEKPAKKEIVKQQIVKQEKPVKKETVKQAQSKVAYTVVKGDTLWNISQKFNVTVDDIRKWNSISANQAIRLGEKLTVLRTGTNTKATSDNNTTRRLTYNVLAGDSLFKIASKFKVTTSDLVRWNDLEKAENIRPGQKLHVYVKAENYPV